MEVITAFTFDLQTFVHRVMFAHTAVAVYHLTDPYFYSVLNLVNMNDVCYIVYMGTTYDNGFSLYRF